MLGRPPVPVLDRLLAKLKFPDSGCWIWTGSTRKGYGQIRALNDTGDWSVRGAHVVAYEELVGPVPAGKVLDHLCRVPACANPMHLEPVTQRTNIERGLAGQRWGVTPIQEAPTSGCCAHCSTTFPMNARGRRRRFCSAHCRTTFWNNVRAA